MLPVESLHLTPEVKSILDAAAAPGGKPRNLHNTALQML